MIFPWNTDAPIYHFPWASIGLIAVNTAVFLAVLSGQIPDPEPWTLVYGHGLHPLQWISSNFLHAGWIHLICNMIFLWGFGLVVEGKIGWWRFLVVFLGIGIIECALEQTLTLHSKGASLGASAILYGLLAIALVWAPRNEMSCVALIDRVRVFDMPILAFAGLYLALEICSLLWADFGIGPSMLHLFGAAIGFVVGVAMLKLGWVDCENWDLFAVMAGREGKEPPPKKSVQAAAPPTSPARLAEAKARLHELVEAGQFDGALALHLALTRSMNGWQLSEAEMLGLIQGLHTAGKWNESIPLMVESLGRWPERSLKMRLKLAQILIGQQRPGQALEVLAKIPSGTLDGKLEAARKSLQQQAEELRSTGVMELDSHDW